MLSWESSHGDNIGTDIGVMILRWTTTRVSMNINYPVPKTELNFRWCSNEMRWIQWLKIKMGWNVHPYIIFYFYIYILLLWIKCKRKKGRENVWYIRCKKNCQTRNSCNDSFKSKCLLRFVRLWLRISCCCFEMFDVLAPASIVVHLNKFSVFISLNRPNA